jgi:predicted ATPase
MIREAEIQNFKSIRKLYLACRRINLFIGLPDAGKSNATGCCGRGSPGSSQNTACAWS